MRCSDQLEVLCDQGPFPAPGQLACAVLCVGGRYTRSAVQAYAKFETHIHTLVDWPSGLGKPTVRQIEAVAAAKDGAHGIELMAHMPHVVNGQAEALREDLQGVVIAARQVRRDIVVNVAIEAEWVVDDESLIEQACLAIRESGADAIVTSAGFPAAGQAYTQAVSWVCKHAGPMPVKVVCPGDDPDPPEKWLETGAARVGVAASVLCG